MSMQKRFRRLSAALTLLAVPCLAWAQRGADIVVNSLDDPGEPDDGLTTLREAIDEVHDIGGGSITFDPSLAGGTIQPLSQLPNINADNGITIDGDLANDGVPDIELDGSLAGDANGLLINSSNNTIRGLVINRFMYTGVKIFGTSATNNVIEHCYIGTDFSGSIAQPNASRGIWIQDGPSSNTIGPGNVISGNESQGILISGESNDNTVIGCRIGTTRDGSAPLGNTHAGIIVGSSSRSNTIGPDNVISANALQGIIIGTGALLNVVTGNVIGLDVDGAVDLGNGGHGIALASCATNNTIGPGNVISGNSAIGVRLGLGEGPEPAFGNIVTGNLIGTDSTGQQDLGNNTNGVWIGEGSHDNTIGPDNVISGNASHGIRIGGFGTTNNVVTDNLVGVTAEGTSALGNNGHTVFIVEGATDNTIGPGNVLSAGLYNGVALEDQGTTGNTVTGNLIGTDATGKNALGNGESGIGIRDGASGNTIGPDNVISGNVQHGVIVGWFGEPCTGNIVHNNLVGTDPTGTSPIPNGSIGITLNNSATSNVIGPGNVISGNESQGILISGGSNLNTVTGCLIGTTADGLTALGNRWHGVLISTSDENTIGPGNLISANGDPETNAPGVAIGPAANDNIVIGNLIGTDANGSVPLPNFADGVIVTQGSSRNVIGGPSPDERNVISGNGRDGITIGSYADPCIANRVENNYIGITADGTEALGNTGYGVRIDNAALNNTIGPSNVISGNDSNGVWISGFGTTNNTITDNLIGTDINGASAIPNNGVGLVVTTGAYGNTIGPGNVISGNSCEGVLIEDASETVVHDNKVGTDSTGTMSLPNQCTGVLIRTDSANNTIGPGNVISGNASHGVMITDNGCTDNVVIDNLVGVSADGASGLGNKGQTVLIDNGATDNVIGPGNVLSAGLHNGVAIQGEDTTDNLVIGNLIGTDATGISALGNDLSGVAIVNGASNNIIGPDNVISGNNQNGVIVGLFGAACNNNQIIGNLIGISADQSEALGQGADGIVVNGGSSNNLIGPDNDIGGSAFNNVVLEDFGTTMNSVFDNRIGTQLPGDFTGNDGVDIRGGASGNVIGPGNVIAYHAVHGVNVNDTTSTDNTISENSITANFGSGIELSGGNNGLFAPAILIVTRSEVSGTASVPDGGVVELFVDSEDEGETFIGSTIVEGGEFALIVEVPTEGANVTATVTDADGNTSAFSAVIDCNGNGIQDPLEIGTGDAPDCNDNGIPDDCDIGEGSSMDVNDNGVPDECEVPLGAALSCVKHGGVGELCLDLPLDGATATDPRIDGGTKLLLVFDDSPVPARAEDCSNIVIQRCSGGIIESRSLQCSLDTDESGRILTITFPGLPDQKLPGEDCHTVDVSAVGVAGDSDFVIRLLAGDANSDTLVDPLDSGAVLARFGCDVDALDPGCVRADINNDGTVDPLDTGAVLARFGDEACLCD